MARDNKTKRRRKKLRRVRNRLWGIYWCAWSKATATPFRRRRLLGLGIGRNITVTFDLDHETPVPVAALDPTRPAESAKSLRDAIREAEVRVRDRGRP